MKRIKARYAVIWRESSGWNIHAVEMTGTTPIHVGVTKEIEIKGLGTKTHILTLSEYYDHYYNEVGVTPPNYVDGITVVECPRLVERLLIEYDPNKTEICVILGR